MNGVLGISRIDGIQQVNAVGRINGANGIVGTDLSYGAVSGKQPFSKKENVNQSQKTDDSAECKTCKNRKYQDGSNEMVSFKSPSHISPQASSSAVRAHEQEHVTNAYSKAATGNGKVVRASVSLQSSVCPECGRSYVSGGTTSTQIKYYNEENPYQKDLKVADGLKYRGNNLNLAV